jgi:hypothetical protein
MATRPKRVLGLLAPRVVVALVVAMGVVMVFLGAALPLGLGVVLVVVGFVVEAFRGPPRGW